MNENNSTKEQFTNKWNGSNHESWHRDKYAGDSNYFRQNILTTKHIKNKSSANGMVTTDWSVFVEAYGHFVVVV